MPVSYAGRSAHVFIMVPSALIFRDCIVAQDIQLEFGQKPSLLCWVLVAPLHHSPRLSAKLLPRKARCSLPIALLMEAAHHGQGALMKCIQGPFAHVEKPVQAYRERLEGKGSPDWLWEAKPEARELCGFVQKSTQSPPTAGTYKIIQAAITVTRSSSTGASCESPRDQCGSGLRMWERMLRWESTTWTVQPL